MKVYVDKMPKNCDKCEIYKLKLGCCNTEFLNTNGKNERHSNCPLQSLQDHDKEIRKQVCDKIREELGKVIEVGDYYDIENDTETSLVKMIDIDHILDQI